MEYKTENMEIDDDSDSKMIVFHLGDKGLTLFFDYDEFEELKTMVNKVKHEKI